jgi:hypothetical protein
MQALYVPVHPGEVVLPESGCSRVNRVSREGNAVCLADGIKQLLRIVGKVGKLHPSAEHQQVVLLRNTRLVVDFFPTRRSTRLVSVAVITFGTMHPVHYGR